MVVYVIVYLDGCLRDLPFSTIKVALCHTQDMVWLSSKKLMALKRENNQAARYDQNNSNCAVCRPMGRVRTVKFRTVRR